MDDILFKSELLKVSTLINEENVIDDTIFELVEEDELDTLFRLYDKLKKKIRSGFIKKNVVNGIVVENESEYKTHAYLVANSKNYLDGESFQYSANDVALLLTQNETFRNRLGQINEQLNATVKIINSFGGVVSGMNKSLSDFLSSGDNQKKYSTALKDFMSNFNNFNQSIVQNGINAFLLENQRIDLKNFNYLIPSNVNSQNTTETLDKINKVTSISITSGNSNDSYNAAFYFWVYKFVQKPWTIKYSKPDESLFAAKILANYDDDKGKISSFTIIDGGSHASTGTPSFTLSAAPTYTGTGAYAAVITVNVTSTNTVGTSSLPPTIASFTPATGGSGTTVTITGTNLTGATSVKFGVTPATSFTVGNATSITAVVGTGTTGKISVTTPGGTVTSSGTFTFIPAPFIPAPTIISFTPTTGGSGALVTIKGTNLTGATSVSFGGTSATSITEVTATSITAVVGTGTTGTISVTTPGGTATSTSSFTFISAIAAPTITSFMPKTGKVNTIVTITGTNFTGATSVSFEENSATITDVTATSITVIVGYYSTGQITVTTPGGTVTSSEIFILK